jgi:NAD(P)-dependent dehydrogenase (short-subunit alcohol dehydrogenase family)
VTRRILVTGGSQGIGLAMACGLAAEGHEVAVFSRTPPPVDDQRFPDAGRLIHLAGDFRVPASVGPALTPWLDSIGGAIDVLIHCAVAYGSDGRRPLLACTLAEWDAALQVNARGLLLALQVVLPRMTANGKGLIVGLSSDIATQPGPGRIPYAASKAAAHAIMLGLTEELTGSGICVLEIMPTVQVDTPGIRRRRPPDFEPIGYAGAGIFVSPARWLMTDDVTRHHGSCLLVDRDGRLLDAEGSVLR